MLMKNVRLMKTYLLKTSLKYPDYNPNIRSYNPKLLVWGKQFIARQNLSLVEAKEWR